MSLSPYLLDLSITLTPPPASSPPEVLATITLRCDKLGLSHIGDLLTNPLKPKEREDLQWYLEEYWKWPFEGFAQRGQQIEALLPQLGERLYQAVFGSFKANSLLQAWRLHPGTRRQISILSDLPKALSLPWELLHDEQGFLVLRTRNPVALVRRLPQGELAGFATPFDPPLRVLLVTARPDGAGFVDPRSIARELLDEVQEQVEQGTIAVEFLRPPTLHALRTRLSDAKRPSIHILHFDGHGAFQPDRVSQDGLTLNSQGQGLLAFEDENGQLDLVKAEDVAQVLQDSGVRLAVFNACQSAISSDEALSSVAAHLIRCGMNAVVAMSASVLVACATRYVKAFYHELAAGTPVTTAQERARQALYDSPHRHLLRRYRDKEGTPIKLRDWWLPHFYQQRPLLLRPTKPVDKRKQQVSTPTPRLNKDMPKEPRYGFSGRSRELLQLERYLLHGKLVVIHGFGGVGKTAFAREAADWLTQADMYAGACFVSFEHGNDDVWLLGELGRYLDIYDSTYNPNDKATALARLKPVLKERRILVIADNLESILPAGEAPLDVAARIQLWDVLLELGKLGAGVLLTSRDTAFGDGRLAPGNNTAHLLLGGLSPEDAYELATRLLTDLGIDRRCASYVELRGLLKFLDYHPLAIHLVLPTLRQVPLARITAEFASLLPKFVDDTATGRNRSLLASLDYSLRRLPEERRAFLSRLALFEGGATEDKLLAITQIPEAAWATLRPALEQAALLVAEQVHEALAVPYLHFHPVLLPSLRQEAGTGGAEEEETALRQRYTQRYAALADSLEREAFQHPEPMYALVRRELPNLRKALELLLQAGEMEAASRVAAYLTKFLTDLGLTRERDRLRRRVEQALAAVPAPADGGLTPAEYMHELGRARDERGSGKVRAAFARLTRLLFRIQALPDGADDGPGSFSHCCTLQELGYCQQDAGQLEAAVDTFREALTLLEALLEQQPEERTMRILHAGLLNNLGAVLRDQGQYAQAQARYEQALQEHRAVKDTFTEAVTLEHLGTLALKQGGYTQARSRYLQALEQYRAIGDPARQAVAWHQLGRVAQNQRVWTEAVRCYRESLALKERVGDIAGAANTCNQLAMVAEGIGRPAEAEGWYKGALERIERVELGSMAQAKCLNNLAGLLVDEVRAGRATRSQLVEARRYAEQAQRIREQPGISADIWTTYGVLAKIAELEEQPEGVRDYRRQERESYAAFAGNRYRINQQHADLIEAIVAAARGDTQVQEAVAAKLPELEKHGWDVSDAIRRIWKGERDWQVLAEGLDGQNAMLILRVLETLASPSSNVSPSTKE